MSFHLPKAQVVELEGAGEALLGQGHEGRELLHHRGAHEGRGEVLDAVVGAHQGGEPGEVVVVGVGVEDALDLVDARCPGR